MMPLEPFIHPPIRIGVLFTLKFDLEASELSRKERILSLAAQKVLGDKFDVRAFHDEVLKNGSITLRMLREKIVRWLTASGRK